MCVSRKIGLAESRRSFSAGKTAKLSSPATTSDGACDFSNVQRSAVRSIAWLGLNGVTTRQSQTNKKNGTDERQYTSSRSNKHVKRRQYAHRGRREQSQMRRAINGDHHGKRIHVEVR